MNRFNWLNNSFWARDDGDFKLDGSTYKTAFSRPQMRHLGKKPGDATHYYQYQLDGWEHKFDGNNGVGMSKLRIPEAVDPTNWRPLASDEEDIFHKRRELHVKNRRKFWQMRYNPKTETYFAEQWSDRAIAQNEWSNSVWFRMTANQFWTSSYHLTNIIAKFLGSIFCVWWYMSWHQHNNTPGRIWAPATDMQHWEIEVVDMTRNNYTPVGEYRNGEFRPFDKKE